ncbi:MAG TPA: hypothetical protein VFH00_05860 [Candidatus Nitrosotalea sp.]|nr:hypothetical protein [Candidatus Nitrosotalea sp.]
MLDRTKVPSDLWVQRLWVPDGSAPGRTAVALVTDKKRLLIGGGIMVLGFAVVIATRALQAPWTVALTALFLELVGGLYAAGGQRSGFYEVAPDGSLGDYLGRKRPDLNSMRGMKVQ